MLVIPAIDIVAGKCVRLARGDFTNKTIYNDNPVEVAKLFEAQGAQRIHVVDLDGAKSGHPVNQALILAIAKAVKVPVQVGGGIRAYENAREYLANGVESVILSTAIVNDMALMVRLLADFGHTRIMSSVDIKNGQVVTHGWLEESNLPIVDLLANLKRIGVRSLVVTDTFRDGMLDGPNFELSKQIADNGFDVIAAGGISSQNNIEEFAKLGIKGVVVGKAIYENRIDLHKTQNAVKYQNNIVKRIIPCLDVKDGRVVKGTHFKELHDIGDPVELARRYSQDGADELVFLDITATLEGRETFRKLVSQIAKEINIPFTVGGGISSIENIRALLNAGADKISIGSAAVSNSNLVKKSAHYFGSQCIVISVDAKRHGNSWNVYIKGGTEVTDVDAIEFSKSMEQQGAGELLVNSLDRDGTKSGFDLELLQRIVLNTNLPVIASSGAGSVHDFLRVFQATDIDAALGASIFHYGEVSIMQLKQFLQKEGLKIRL